jgi:hypothetical protein
MALGKTPEQSIAVFGESGSGKTVLLSSFYGATQEPKYIKDHQLNIVADSTSQGARLMQNYLGMKNSATVPGTNKFKANTYKFRVKPKSEQGSIASDALHLVWHDYPGEWLHEDVSGPVEAQRRVDTFRELLGSDVALLLVDGQKLREYKGEESRYLKSMLTNLKNGLLLLKDDLLPDGKPLVTFPRIWVLALSKSDLLPHMDVFAFRDILLEHAGADIADLRDVIAGLVDSDDALSVGDDFVLLSSAKFSPERIEVTQRVGLNLVLPLAAHLPFTRHLRWAETGKVARKVAIELLGGTADMAEALGVFGNLVAVLLGSKNRVLSAVGLVLSRFGPSLSEAARIMADRLKDADEKAFEKANSLAGAMLQFRDALAKAESERILLRSQS